MCSFLALPPVSIRFGEVNNGSVGSATLLVGPSRARTGRLFVPVLARSRVIYSTCSTGMMLITMKSLQEIRYESSKTHSCATSIEVPVPTCSESAQEF